MRFSDLPRVDCELSAAEKLERVFDLAHLAEEQFRERTRRESPGFSRRDLGG